MWHCCRREAFSEEFTDLLDYLNAAAEDAESGIRTEAVRKLHDGVRKLKQAETTGVRYMQEWEERVMEQQQAREEGLSQGLSQGEMVKVVSQIRRKLQKGRQEDEIAEALEESISVVHKVKEILGTNAELSDLEIARRYF